MKQLGFLVLAVAAALAVRSTPAAADPPAYYCELTGAGYLLPNGGDSYQFCIDNCYVLDAQGQPIYGECWTSPPPPPPPPGTGNGPIGGPDTQT